MPRQKKPLGERARDIAPTGVRLPPDLRDAIAREAHVSGRSLSAEMLACLRARYLPAAAAASAAQPYRVAEPAARDPVPPLGESQRLLLARFGRLSPERQLAMLTFLGIDPGE